MANEEKHPKKDHDAEKLAQTQRMVDKIQSEIDAGDTSPEKAQDLVNQKAKLAKLMAEDDEPEVA